MTIFKPGRARSLRLLILAGLSLGMMSDILFLVKTTMLLLFTSPASFTAFICFLLAEAKRSA